MKRKLLLLTLMYLCVHSTASYSALNSDLKKEHPSHLDHSQIDNNPVRIVSSSAFFNDYQDLKWCHIGRIQAINSDVDLKQVKNLADLENLKFIHKKNENFAYRLYNGDFAVFLSSSN